MQQIEEQAGEAKTAIDDYHAARARYAQAVRLEAEMESQRPAVKLDAILRLMQQPDKRAKAKEGEPAKTWPATEAERYVEMDETYASFILNQRNLAHSRMRAETDFRSAYLRAELQIAVVKIGLGVL